MKKQPFFTLLNTFSLTIGIAGGMLISLYVYDELSFDKMFLDSDRIYRINSDIKFGGEVMHLAETGAPMAGTILNDFSQVENVTRIRNRGSLLLRKSGIIENTKEDQVAFADSTLFDFFGINLLVGDSRTALTEPNTIVMTKTAAEKHFGVNNALGQTLLLNNEDTYTVTGVIEDLPKNSLLRDHSLFMALAGYDDAQQMFKSICIQCWKNIFFLMFNNFIPELRLNPLLHLAIIYGTVPFL